MSYLPPFPKKHLGQHFLIDKNIAKKIINSLTLSEKYTEILEVGPGRGILTQYLKELNIHYTAVEIDKASVEYLLQTFPDLTSHIICDDFLKINLQKIFDKPFAVIGNFPYNISSQILFKILENKSHIPEAVGMFQKEVAERIIAPPCNKIYGILSVLVQAFYNVEYLFTINESVFNPRPKVKSGLLRMTRKDDSNLQCDEKLFFQVVKAAFNQRRKTLKNALKSYNFAVEKIADKSLLSKRAEQLTVNQFTELTHYIESLRKKS